MHITGVQVPHLKCEEILIVLSFFQCKKGYKLFVNEHLSYLVKHAAQVVGSEIKM